MMMMMKLIEDKPANPHNHVLVHVSKSLCSLVCAAGGGASLAPSTIKMKLRVMTCSLHHPEDTTWAFRELDHPLFVAQQIVTHERL